MFTLKRMVLFFPSANCTWWHWTTVLCFEKCHISSAVSHSSHSIALPRCSFVLPPPFLLVKLKLLLFTVDPEVCNLTWSSSLIINVRGWLSRCLFVDSTAIIILVTLRNSAPAVGVFHHFRFNRHRLSDLLPRVIPIMFDSVRGMCVPQSWRHLPLNIFTFWLVALIFSSGEGILRECRGSRAAEPDVRCGSTLSNLPEEGDGMLQWKKWHQGWRGRGGADWQLSSITLPTSQMQVDRKRWDGWTGHLYTVYLVCLHPCPSLVECCLSSNHPIIYQSITLPGSSLYVTCSISPQCLPLQCYGLFLEPVSSWGKINCTSTETINQSQPHRCKILRQLQPFFM